MKSVIAMLLVLACPLITTTAAVVETPPLRDIVFAEVDSHKLRLDLFPPDGVRNPPLVVFIHGGGWRNGSYKNCRVKWLTNHGYAVASIGYRLSDKATFPAQVFDCKAAVRWLRANADTYGYSADRIGVAGTSAGGHLALMLGVTGGVQELEGKVGGHLDQSSKVQAVVDYFGPADFVLRSERQPSRTDLPDSPVRLLLGGPVSEKLDLAKQASPALQVTAGDAPLLIIHGDEDQVVHLAQSKRIAEAYKKQGLDVAFEIVAGAGHGGNAHFTPKYQAKVVRFLDRHLKESKSQAAAGGSNSPRDAK
jgi:acetyl esterase/lipase